MSRRKSATPKERVLAKWPTARAVGLGTTPTSGGYLRYAIYRVVRRWPVHVSAPNESEDAAWADAAKRLRGKR